MPLAFILKHLEPLRKARGAFVPFWRTAVTLGLGVFRLLQSEAGQASAVSEASDVASGALYAPYYLGLFALCGVVVFAMPNSWQLTARLSWPRVAFATTAMVLATLMMWTQTINPFLYFQF